MRNADFFSYVCSLKFHLPLFCEHVIHFTQEYLVLPSLQQYGESSILQLDLKDQMQVLQLDREHTRLGLASECFVNVSSYDFSLCLQFLHRV